MTLGLQRASKLLMAALLLLVAACGGKIELFGQLPEREANEVLGALLRAGIPAEKQPGKNGVAAIRVDQGAVSRAMDILNNAGLPRDRFANMGELFRREGLISSPSEERVRYMYGITQELSRTLTGIDGVLSARVHVVLPNNDPSAATRRPSSAAVLIRHAPSAAIDAIVPRIKELVVNSIEGMSYDRVSVVLVRANPDEAPLAEPEPAPTMPPLAVWGMAAGLLIALTGNAVLGLLLWRRRRAKPASLVSATP